MARDLIVEHYERRFGLPPGMLGALVGAESGGNPNAVSPKGAQGLAQVMPATAKDPGYGVQPMRDNSRAENVRFGAEYLSAMLNEFKDPKLALAAYNAGPGAVKEHGGVPPFPETQSYVSKIMGSLNPIGTAQAEEVQQPERRQPIDLFKARGIDPGKLQQAQAAAADPTEGMSATESALRGGGVAVRGAVKGALSLPLMFGEGLNTAVNYGIKGINALADTDIPYIPQADASLNTLLNRVGLPEPRNPQERMIESTASGTAAALTPAGVAKSVQAAGGATSRMADQMLKRLDLQTLSGMSSGASAQAAQEAGMGPVGQGLAGLAGGMVPYAPSALRVGAHRLMGGAKDATDAQRIASNIQTFEDLGTTPSVGQATETRAARVIESGGARMPGSAGVLIKKGHEQAKAIQGAVEKAASELAPKTSAITTGRSIEKAITGEGGFINWFKAKQKSLYDKLDNAIPKDTMMNVSRTRKVIQNLNQDIEHAPHLSQWFKNAKIEGLKESLEKDLRGKPGEKSVILNSRGEPFRSAPTPPRNTMPYESIKKLRTLVGQEIDNNSLLSEIPRSKWKALYAAISEDLGDAAKQAGPRATKAWETANRFTKAGLNRIDMLETVTNKQVPEDVFNAAISGTREGATRLHAVLNSVPEKVRGEVTANVLRRMGTAIPSAQDDLGSVWSTETFLTNWNKLSPAAKTALFGSDKVPRYNREFRQSLDTVAKAAANLREGSRVFANPSGTSQALTLQNTVFGAIMAFVTGNVGTAAGIGAGVGLANLGARLMTNPRFVKWLSRTTKMPLSARANVITSLANSARNDPDIQEFVKTVEQYSE
jgi:hypothetical protein